MEILGLIIPGLVAVLGNIIFYFVVKTKIDKSIEQHKISYTGIYKEKIDVHKEILRLLFDIKSKMHRYQNFGNAELASELMLDFNKFINHYTINQPFIRQELLEVLIEIRSELQLCFDDFYLYHATSSLPYTKAESIISFSNAVNKFRKNQPFQQLEELVIAEMKKDLKIID